MFEFFRWVDFTIPRQVHRFVRDFAESVGLADGATLSIVGSWGPRALVKIQVKV